MPKVSVILSSYNHAPYVAEAIESVLNQTFRDFELLIFDDGSTDGSADIIRSFRDERIKAFLYEENRGPAEAAKEAFYAAQGEYVAIHHSDDVWELDKLEKQVVFLDEHKEYAACFAWASFIDENSCVHELEDGNFYKEVFRQGNRSCIEWLRYFFDHPNCFCHPSLLIRREMYVKHQMIPPESMRQLPDFFMWVSLLAGKEELYIMPETLIRFRLRQNQKDENVSAESMENTLRRQYEYVHIARIYANLSKGMFCQVFPDYEKYIVGNDIRLALGKRFLESDIPVFRFYGLHLLENILNVSADCNSCSQKSYTCQDFWTDAGAVDCFGMRKNMHVAHMALFYDIGQGYQGQLSVQRECYIYENHTFLISFALQVPDGTVALGFAPEKGHMVEVWINSFLVNGKEMTCTNNGLHEEGGKDFFYHGNPMYEVRGIFSGDLDIRISGEMSYPDGMIFATEVYRQKEDIQRQLEEKNRQLEETTCQLEMMENEVQVMRQSTSWRCTKPLRQIGQMVRRWKK